MKRLGTVIILAGTILAGTTAGAAPHGGVWRQAGSPELVWVNDPTQPGGHYDGTTITLNAAPGTNYDLHKTWLHELGHAWAKHQNVDYAKYATLRGFPTFTDETVLVEDYAEFFQTALCDCWPHTGEAPYGFHTAAGVPTGAQFTEAQEAGLLP